MFFYSLAIKLYTISITVAALFNRKAALWVRGRKQWRETLRKQFSAQKNVIWFHCASLGEFEQGRPVMEALKEKHPDTFLLLTFFSPSGFEAKKNVPIADYICYLPPDTKKNSKDFLDIVNPQRVFFIKYEFWFHYINILQRRNIPLYFLSALFRKRQYYFTWIGRWTHRYFQNVTCFFVQNDTSKLLLESIGVKKIIVSGDTRFDRTSEFAKIAIKLPLIEQFKGSYLLLIAGSSWLPEEKLLYALTKCQHVKMKIIIAPHDISEHHIKKIENMFIGATQRYSKATHENIENTPVLIIDNIGLLNSIYHYADIALIGGAFGAGLHNILEALAHGVPVFFGNRIKKFPEAQQAIDAGCAYMISNKQAFMLNINKLLDDSQSLKSLKKKSLDFIAARTGSTNVIMNNLYFF